MNFTWADLARYLEVTALVMGVSLLLAPAAAVITTTFPASRSRPAGGTGSLAVMTAPASAARARDRR